MHPGDEIDTPRGPARVQVDRPIVAPASLLVLGHGAGGGVDAPDLVAVRDAAVAAGVAVARVTQPYRVAGRRAPAPAGQLDEAWTAVVGALCREVTAPALIVGGRSSGARVACRTALGLGAVGVVALAFPLHPPARRAVGSAAVAAARRSRAGELATGLPTLVVNGDRDPFGVPSATPGVGQQSAQRSGAHGQAAGAAWQVRVEVRPGERHDLRRDPAGTAAIVVRWLRTYGWAR